MFLSSSCNSSRKIREQSKRIEDLDQMLSQYREQDSLKSLDITRIDELGQRLDKTERVLAQIYLQYAANIPRKVEGMDNQTLNAFVAGENLQLIESINLKKKEIDSLKQHISYINSQPPPVFESTIDNSSKSKKSKSSTDQQLYINQLEASIQTELAKNRQLSKELNAYSLKLEIIDNERLKQTGELSSLIQSQKSTIDSLNTQLTHQNDEIASLQTKMEESKNVKLSSKDLKLKDQLKIKEKEIIELKSSIAEIDKNTKSLNTRIKELESELNISKENSEKLNKEINTLKTKTSSQSKEPSISTDAKLKVQIDELKRDNEKLTNKLIEQNNELTKFTKQNVDLQDEVESLKSAKSSDINKSSSPDLDKIKSQEQKLAELNSTINQLQENNKSKDALIEEINSKNEDQTKTIENQNKQILELSKKASKTSSNRKNNTKENLLDSIKSREDRILELEREITNIKTRSESEKITVAESNKKSELMISELKDKNNSLLSEVTSLQEQVSSLTLKNQELSTTTTFKATKNTKVKSEANLPKPEKKIYSSENIDKATESSSQTSNQIITDDLILKIQKVLTENDWPGMSVRKEDNSAIIVVPQTFVFFNETLALKEEGSRLILRIFNSLNNIKKNQIDIIVYSESSTFTDEFNHNRARTVSKLFKALGAPASNINTGARVYVEDVDINNFKEGVELIIRPL